MTDNTLRSLPVSIVGSATTSGERNEYLVNLLEKSLPSCDTKSISDELKREFVLNKHRVKHVRPKSSTTKFLSARKRTILGLNKLKNGTNLKYTDMLALNELWLEYMRKVLHNDTSAVSSDQPTKVNWHDIRWRLLKSDFHGARISVVRSKCPSLVGIGGIILQDTKCTFKVLGEDNIIRTIPKNIVMFNLYLEDTSIQLFGKKLCVRPSERSVKKFKSSVMPDL